MIEREIPVARETSACETHLSSITMVGDLVYKQKLPVSNDVVDLRDRATRHELCEREVELNRRLAPDVYLGVEVAPSEPGEPAVVMRRMPNESRLSTRILAGTNVRSDVRAVAATMAWMYARAVRAPHIDEAGSASSLLAAWSGHLDALEGHAHDILDPQLLRRTRLLAERYVSGRGELLHKRIADGRVCDGHGDLVADDIFCLADGPRILDCVEYSNRHRYADALSDIATLAMDCERLGRPALTEELLSAYREFSGDAYPSSLAHHYIAYRAIARAAEECARYERGDGHAPRRARRLVELAFIHLEHARPVLAIVGGVHGAGKSSLSRAVADAMEWTVIHIDERPEQSGTDDSERARIYGDTVRRAQELLRAGESVVIDAEWASDVERGWAKVAAVSSASDFVAIRCDAPAEALQQRLVESGRTGAADPIAMTERLLAPRFEEWPDAHVVDTGRSLGHSLSSSIRIIGISGADRAEHRDMTTSSATR